ncbi:non-ribosomal peptide synthetase [Aspergillus affinis]|uniref:non-ribosomal peptide synthetase n=1 Tax=Aspergillus affinis TaxID=1070780 RepID=UPI0022FE5FB4|nr:uncharacterized protein KD926_000083 [Aspergillus affinis]KAI9037667.1 hypothetical protein KD926_000083 [Aspergillus affinis]
MAPIPQSNITSLLDQSALSSAGIVAYPEGDRCPPTYLSYAQLRDRVSHKAEWLRRVDGFRPNAVTLVHFRTHLDNITWFWASILAGSVPALSPPLVNTSEGRRAHFKHLHQLLEDPLVLTHQTLATSDFGENELLRVVTIDESEKPVSNGVALDTVDTPNGIANGHHSNGSDESTNSHTNGYANGHSNGSSNGHSNGSSNGHSNGVTDSKVNSHTNGVTNESVDGYAAGYASGYASGYAKGYADGQGNRESNRDTHGHTNSKVLANGGSAVSNGAHNSKLDGVAVLMLTSGSSGNSKAVCLSHEQIFASIRGKLAAMPVTEGSAVLNWIGLDHVASLMETHLLSMYAGVDQIQIQAVEVLSNPLLFLRLLSQHAVSMTFSPDFFLKKLLAALDSASEEDKAGIDLSHLLYLVSGGEPNNVNTGIRVTEYLRKLGVVPKNLITPGFGMTEICAGAIYNRAFPEVDIQARRDAGALGKCIPGIEMRISRAPQDEPAPNPSNSAASDAGMLEVRGPVVFSRYFNNEEATRGSFTEDGWFQTGDLGTIDEEGNLKLAGRLKELININSVKYLPHEIEGAINQERIPGVTPSFVVCFSHRPTEGSAEQVYVVYQHEYASDDTEARMSTLHALIRTVLLFTSARPRVLPLPPGRLEKTTLGKLARSKIHNAMVQGKYADQEELNESILQSYRDAHFSAPRDDMEHRLMAVFKETLGLEDMEMGIDMPILDTGISSVDLIRLKRAAETNFGIAEIPMMTIMTNTTIRSLAAALQDFKTSAQVGEYQAVVTLQPHGIKTPLWLFHPGIGEILVFLALAQHFPDRPVYAMRPRGFNPGEEPFQNLDDLMTTYYTALRKQQPKGPYAMAGYSYGSVLAFEIAKKLEADGEEVKFLGSFNLPPHIKQRMRQLDWSAGLSQISHFCDIISEDRSREMVSELRPLPKSEQIARVLAEADPVRTAALGLSQASLHTWVNVSFSLQKIGWEYDPSGTVSHIDVFFCDPLRDVASSRHEYRYTKLNHWADFVRNDLQFHEVDGAHYTMIMPENVPKFQQTLKNVLAARGL